MSLPTSIKHIKAGELEVGGKTAYYDGYTSMKNALWSARNSTKRWICTHPAIPYVMIMRPVDAGRVELAGGKIINHHFTQECDK